MPATIASGDLVSEPRNWSDWQTVVQKTIEHYSGEKALDNVYYEVWNEPDLFGKWTMGGKKDYKQLYLYSARGAANARGVKPFKLGGPATTGLYKNWLDYFLPYVLENNLRLDFISWHRYDLDIEKYTEDVESVDTWLDKHPYYANVEKIVSEMGPASDKESVNNSMMGAAHLIASAREFLFKIKYGFNFSVKDGPGNDNGWGIINSAGQTKPRYQALQMLAKLGDSRLAVTGEGSWVRAIAAQSDKSYQVVVVNYDPKNSHSEAVPVSFINLTPGKFLLQQTTLGGITSKTEVATTEAVLQQQIPLTPNSAVFLELTPVNPPSE
jgi:xylan 1,4-beta-xylosidase